MCRRDVCRWAMPVFRCAHVRRVASGMSVCGCVVVVADCHRDGRALERIYTSAVSSSALRRPSQCRSHAVVSSGSIDPAADRLRCRRRHTHSVTHSCTRVALRVDCVAYNCVFDQAHRNGVAQIHSYANGRVVIISAYVSLPCYLTCVR